MPRQRAPQALYRYTPLHPFCSPRTDALHLPQQDTAATPRASLTLRKQNARSRFSCPKCAARHQSPSLPESERPVRAARQVPFPWSQGRQNPDLQYSHRQPLPPCDRTTRRLTPQAPPHRQLLAHPRCEIDSIPPRRPRKAERARRASPLQMPLSYRHPPP